MEIYAKILGFMAIILVGYAAKRLGLVREQAIGWLSALVLNVTLPCTVLRGLNGQVLDPAYFALLAMGFALNFFCLGLGRLTAGRSPLPVRGFCMINIAGYNIGMFAMAFIQSFFDASVFMVICLCDVGNAIMTMGGNYAVAARASRAPGMDARRMAKIVLLCVGFHCYVAMIVLSVLHLRLPEPVMAPVRLAAFANPYLCMFMIGIGLKFTISRKAAGTVARILAVRYASAFLLAAAAFLLPVDRSVSAALALFLLSPVSGLGPVYTFKLAPELLNDSSMCICLAIRVSTAIYLVLIPMLLQHAL